jgi:tetratricopeptide (TPR) repeat protein
LRTWILHLRSAATSLAISLLIVLTWSAATPAGVSSASAAENRQEQGTLLASEFTWKEGMAEDAQDDRCVLVLLARGFLKFGFFAGSSTIADDLDERVAQWLKAHPRAVVVPILDTKLGEDATFRHVWLVDAGANLCIDLLREGVCSTDEAVVSDFRGDLIVEQTRYDEFRSAAVAAQAEAIEAKRGVWADPRNDGLAHWKQAEALEKAGKLPEAIAEFQKAAEQDVMAGPAWFRIGVCYTELERYEEAVAAFDRSMSDELRRVPGRDTLAQFHKALALSKWRGPDEAVKMLEASIADAPASLELHGVLADFHFHERRFEDARKAWQRGIDRFIERNGITFEGDQFRLDTSRFQGAEEYRASLASLSSYLARAASCCLEAEDFDQAYRLATMGLRVAQSLGRYYATLPHLKENYPPEVAEAGDVDCRLARAKVFNHRASFAEAKHEVDQAKLLIDAGQLQGARVAEMIQQAYAELRRAFPDESVVIPPKYERPKARRARTEDIDYKAATDLELVELAAGDEPTYSFAALDELLKRDEASPLAPEVLDRLVVDGLKRQADHEHRWRWPYGILIELAYERGRLSDAQLQALARHCVVLAKPMVRTAPDRSDGAAGARLTVNHMVEYRAAHTRDRSSVEASAIDLCARIRIVRVTFDGQEFPAQLSGRAAGTAIDIHVSAGGGTHFSYMLKIDKRPAAGKHTLHAEYRVEVRRLPAELRERFDAYRTYTGPTVAEWTIERDHDVWIEADDR